MRIIHTILFTLLLVTGVSAQTPAVQPVLAAYLKMKDALVKSDAVKTAEYATELIAAINSTDVTALKPKESKSFRAEKENLLKLSDKIVAAKDIEKQRSAFAPLSVSMWKIVKTSESISSKVYYQYCPMKKSYWISTEENIKNPYYGSKMLTCGNVSDKK
ncbi:MAG: DUF3347 domain-containing protein [Bacteroidia bacterium]